jgi:hypothetical protein
MPQEVTIFLTPTDSELFKSFQQFHKTFELLCKSGAFDIKNGSFVCHMDNEGNIKKIERHDSLFDSRIKLPID